MTAWTDVPLACLVCGASIDQPSTGRPRFYCTDACRKTACRRRQAAAAAIEAARAARERAAEEERARATLAVDLVEILAEPGAAGVVADWMGRQPEREWQVCSLLTFLLLRSPFSETTVFAATANGPVSENAQARLSLGPTPGGPSPR